MLSSFESSLTKAVSVQQLPGTVVSARNSSGTFQYTQTSGSPAIQKDAIFWLASATKIVTTIAALQCVETGLFGLDDDVTRWVPELGKLEILVGFDEGERALLRERKERITLRHLLTHTSGLAYDTFDPTLTRWRKSIGQDASLDNGSLIYRCMAPLLFEPGSSYSYGTGTDWAGLVVSRATNLPLSSYIAKHILAPLSLPPDSFIFNLPSHPEIASRLLPMSQRSGAISSTSSFGAAADPAAPVIPSPDNIWEWKAEWGEEDESGGTGGYCSVETYQTILNGILGGKLLGKEMNEELFKGQLEGGVREVVQGLLGDKEARSVMTPGLPAGVKVDIALGGMVVLEDVEGGRRKGSLHWSGFPNFFWWMDKEAGISGVYGSQLAPPGDEKSTQMLRSFERAIYAEVKEVEG